MEQHRDELAEAHEQLMWDIYTRGVDDTWLSRRWLGLGLVLVVLGGVVGIMLAIGNRTQETPEVRSPLVSSADDPASQRQPKDLQDWAPLPDPSTVPQQGTYSPGPRAPALRPDVVPPALGAKEGPGPSSASASPRAKVLNTGPRLMNQQKRQAACPRNGCLPRVAQRRPSPPARGSLIEEFDPNAALVRSTP
jgi:hypothetical protein